ncbi:MAG: phosphotransferase [Pseudomonadota bacterium]
MSDQALKVARDSWGLGDAPITLVAARENQVFKTETEHGPAALRLHRPGYRNATEIASEMQWMAMLADRGVLLPKPIPTVTGALNQQAGDYVIDMLTWLDGVPLSQVTPTPVLYKRLGRLIGRMQNYAQDWLPPLEFERPVWDLVGDAPSWGRFWDSAYISQDQRTQFQALREKALDHLATRGTDHHILIHADLVADNVLVEEDKLYPIDFDDGGYGDPLFDLATITNRSLRFDQTGALRAAAIEGYQLVQYSDLRSLPLFEALRAASYIGWISDRMDLPHSKDRLAQFLQEAQARIAALETS